MVTKFKLLVFMMWRRTFALVAKAVVVKMSTDDKCNGDR